MIEGIDVSGWSGNLHYDQIAAACAFVYHQATDGVGTVDKMLMPRTNALRGLGLGSALGAYHFLRVRHGMKQDADEQCKQFMDARANAGCTLAPWLDVELGEERSSNRAATHDEVRAAVELFLETWDASTSSTLMVYSSPGEMSVMGVALVPSIEKRPLALAEYTSKPFIIAPQPWSKWTMWQWDGNASAFGGVVDRVRFDGTIDDLQAM